ncbi:hypothetical protein BaRGS_00001866 [Batillaria attramentaria]|uniref:Uncharacterized protein n=1 Tax=Batillaria attramentaria TaxID=370345 RepID=A0ABD0M659_9CAEN
MIKQSVVWLLSRNARKACNAHAVGRLLQGRPLVPSTLESSRKGGCCRAEFLERLLVDGLRPNTSTTVTKDWRGDIRCEKMLQ